MAFHDIVAIGTSAGGLAALTEPVQKEPVQKGSVLDLTPRDPGPRDPEQAQRVGFGNAFASGDLVVETAQFVALDKQIDPAN